jgi:hypothetical protein
VRHGETWYIIQNLSYFPTFKDMTSNTQDNTNRAPSGTGRTGYSSSPLAQQYDQGTTTGQYDSSRSGEQGIESGAAFGRGQGDTGTSTGVGHHKAHQEGHLHGHGPGETAKTKWDQGTEKFHCFIFEIFNLIIR